MQAPEIASLIIEPIDAELRQRVIDCTYDYVKRASFLFGRRFEPVAVYFDLKGRAAGMYVAGPGDRRIRYNPYIFAKNFNNGLQVTVPHEVAHYITDVLLGLQNIRPHGEEWRRVMRAFGVSRPRATGQYDLSGIPVRRQKRFNYACACREHQLSSVRHNRVQTRKVRYECRSCGAWLQFVGEVL